MEINHKYTDEIVCPWCGYEERDSWDYPNSDDDIKCPECGKVFSMERQTEVLYNTERKKCLFDCNYKLKSRHGDNPYIYGNHNWTIWICTECHNKIVQVGNIATDEKPYVIPWDMKEGDG